MVFSVPSCTFSGASKSSWQRGIIKILQKNTDSAKHFTSDVKATTGQNHLTPHFCNTPTCFCQLPAKNNKIIIALETQEASLPRGFPSSAWSLSVDRGSTFVFGQNWLIFTDPYVAGFWQQKLNLLDLSPKEVWEKEPSVLWTDREERKRGQVEQNRSRCKVEIRTSRRVVRLRVD